MINVRINGVPARIPPGLTILEAAKRVGVKIPSLCYSPDLPAWGACGLCIVRMEGTARMVRSCTTVMIEGMKVVTHDAEIARARRSVLDLILAGHPTDCVTCSRNNSCELQALAADFGLREHPFPENVVWKDVDDSYEEIVFERHKCISCGRCVTICQQVQNVWALEYLGRGDRTVISPAANTSLLESPCVKCGQCAAHCPVGAIVSHHSIAPVLAALSNNDLTCVASIAPSVRAALGEAFGLPPGTVTTGKIYTALRMLGFTYVFDTNFSADVTIMEETAELLGRLDAAAVETGDLRHVGPLPLFTSCCPGWVDYAEKRYPDLLPHLSSTKSPQAIQGALTKTYWAQRMGLAAAAIFHLSVMPCTAKLYESQRNDSMKVSGYPDTDSVLTTREFAALLRQGGIDFPALPESAADNPLGAYSGAGTIFGASGGVLEAAVRNAYALTEKKDLPEINFSPVYGLENVKEAEVTIRGKKLKIAAVHQLGSVDAVVQKVRAARESGTEVPWHFIEVMACRGGCVAGGGQPYGTTDTERLSRAAALYRDDEGRTVRVSRENLSVKEVYAAYLEAPNSEKAHRLLHTTYRDRSR